MYVTGYLLPDESYYFVRFALNNPLQAGFYREAFAIPYSIFFSGVQDLHSFMLRTALWSFTWTFGSLLVLYKVLQLTSEAARIRSMILLSMPLIPVFTLLSTAAVTETPGLFFCLLGVYFSLIYMRSEKSRYALYSALAFVLAYKTREPYLLFALGFLIVILASLRRVGLRKGIPALIAYMIPLFIFLPPIINVSTQSFSFGTPLYVILAQRVFQPSAVQSIPVQMGTASGGFPVLLSWDLVVAFFVSMSLGYNPIFALFAILSVVLGLKSVLESRSEIQVLLLYTMTLGLMSTFLALATSSNIFSWTGAVFRDSHTSLPGIPGFRFIYSRLRLRYLLASIFVLLAVASVLTPLYASVLLSSQGQSEISRVSFAYRDPYYRLDLLARDSGRTLILTGPHPELQLYLRGLPNVTIASVPANVDEFANLTRYGWGSIFLFETYPNMTRAINYGYPAYYRDLLLDAKSNQRFSYGQYAVESLWFDGESYCIRLTENQVG